MMVENKLIKRLTCFYLIPFAVMVLFNTFNSLLRTTYFDLYQEMETAHYKWDNPLLVAAIAAVLIFLIRKAEGYTGFHNRNWKKYSLLWAGGLSLFFVLLFRCHAVCDGETLSDIAVEFSKNNYQAFAQGEYLYQYPFQIGLVAFLELLYTVFGLENFIVFQLLNIGAVLVILERLNCITEELFEDERITGLESILSLGMLPLFLFATFVYGDIIGWGLGVCAILAVIRFLKTEKQKNLLEAVLLLSLGVVVKSNINILAVAAGIAVFLHSIARKKWKYLLWILLLVIGLQAGNLGISRLYVERAGLSEFPKGIPKIAWVAMSMQETDEGGYACGWYNSYNWNVYVNHQFDRQQTSAACVENLKESFSKFLHEQRYAIDFFYKKFTSQWNAPTFQAMITNEWASRYVDNLSPTAEFFLYGLGREILYGIMNIYHFLIFLCTGVYCVTGRKKWSFPKAYFILNIFGGFLFHMIWEAQARYILGYFVLLLPLAAAGLHGGMSALTRMKIKVRKTGEGE